MVTSAGTPCHETTNHVPFLFSFNKQIHIMASAQPQPHPHAFDLLLLLLLLLSPFVSLSLFFFFNVRKFESHDFDPFQIYMFSFSLLPNYFIYFNIPDSTKTYTSPLLTQPFISYSSFFHFILSCLF